MGVMQEIREEAEASEVREFEGRYRIIIHPRKKWWWFRNVKVIKRYGDVYVGKNIAFGFIRWGTFVVYKSDLAKVVCLNYGPGIWPFKYIMDYVRGSDGKFYYKNKFRFDFEMRKVVNDGQLDSDKNN